MSLNVGDIAPEFKLKSHNMEEVALSDYKGKKNVVLLFFPLVNSSVCEKELCSMQDDLSQYANLDAEILAISVDSPFAQKLWADKHNFKFPLLSDFNKEVAREYEAIHEVFAPGKLDLNGVAKRSVFVVDKEGYVKHAEVLDVPTDEPDYNAIKEALDKLD